MLRIGDFSQLAQVSVRTLQYYDEINLLKPSRVDAANDYRYYALEQLPRLNRILALKDLGFSLKQIEGVLEQQLSPEAFKVLLLGKRAVLAQKLEAERAQLERLEARLVQLDAPDVAAYDVVMKRVGTLDIFSKRYTVPDLRDMDAYCTRFYEALYAVLRAQGLAAGVEAELTLFHAREYRESNVDVEVCVVLEPAALKWLELPPDERFTVRKLEGSPTVASISFEGLYRDLGEVGRAMFLWAGSNGYASAGAARELHLAGSILKTGKEQPLVIELQVPVTKDAAL